MNDKSDHYFSIVYRLGSFLKIVMENDLCKSGGLPLQFIMITTNDDEDDWDDDNDDEESFNDTLIPFIHLLFRSMLAFQSILLIYAKV